MTAGETPLLTSIATPDNHVPSGLPTNGAYATTRGLLFLQRAIQDQDGLATTMASPSATERFSTEEQTRPWERHHRSRADGEWTTTDYEVPLR